MKMNRRFFLSAVGSSLGALTVRQALYASERLTGSGETAPIPDLLFGADYYPDQTPESLWAEDARKMAAMGLTVVRVAEFAW